MDERLEKALDYSNYMVTYNNQRRMLKEKFEENTQFFIKGSHFVVNPTLITYVSLLISKGLTSYILLDHNDNPVEVENLEDFLENITQTYFFALNSYHTGISNLRTKRSVEKLIE